MKEEALDRTMWRNRFGRGFGPVVWQITDDDDDDTENYPLFEAPIILTGMWNTTQLLVCEMKFIVKE